MEYPKFEEALKRKVLDPAIQQMAQPGYGIVMGYDQQTNTATILTTKPGSDQTGELYYDVPCPLQLGIQGSAPKPGHFCWLQFKDGTMTRPYITHFFNAMYQQYDYEKNTRAANPLPRYMLGL